MKQTTETLEQIFDATKNKEEFAFELYFLWCESVTTNNTNFQQVLANKSISHWFVNELEKLRKEYVSLVKPYPEATDEDCFIIFISTIYKIFSRFPNALLEQAKKRTDKNSKIQGLPIFNSN